MSRTTEIEALCGLTRVPDVTVREVYWGYVVRSAAPEAARDALPGLALRLARLAAWGAAGVVWLAPGPGLAARLGLSVAFLALALLLTGARARAEGMSFQVDRDKREVRVSRHFAGDIRQVTGMARFDETRGLSLCRIAGETCVLTLNVREGQPLTVAVGPEAVLIGVHDRLRRDLQPLEHRVSGLMAVLRARPGRGPAMLPAGVRRPVSVQAT